MFLLSFDGFGIVRIVTSLLQIRVRLAWFAFVFCVACQPVDLFVDLFVETTVCVCSSCCFFVLFPVSVFIGQSDV